MKPRKLTFDILALEQLFGVFQAHAQLSDEQEPVDRIRNELLGIFLGCLVQSDKLLQTSAGNKTEVQKLRHKAVQNELYDYLLTFLLLGSYLLATA